MGLYRVEKKVVGGYSGKLAEMVWLLMESSVLEKQGVAPDGKLAEVVWLLMESSVLENRVWLLMENWLKWCSS